MYKRERFIVTEGYTIENSFGVIDSNSAAEMEITVEVDTDEGHGWFELYVDEDDVYEEGMLEVEGNAIVGYDGVFKLPDPIIEKLREWGLDVSEIE